MKHSTNRKIPQAQFSSRPGRNGHEMDIFCSHLRFSFFGLACSYHFRGVGRIALVFPESKLFSVLTGFLSYPPQSHEILGELFNGNYFFHPDLQRTCQRLSPKGRQEKVNLTWGTRAIPESENQLRRPLAGSFPKKGPDEPSDI